jgi:apolipoprotein N-acyltransferase
MGQGYLGGAMNQRSGSSLITNLARYRVVTAFAVTAVFVAVKAVGRDFWGVAFGLATLALIALAPVTPERPEPWREHALRVVTASFLVVALGSIWITLTR